MSDNGKHLVSVTDVFGLGRAAESDTAKKLLDAIVSGVGELTHPWRLRRTFKAQLELAKLSDTELPENFDAEIGLEE